MSRSRGAEPPTQAPWLGRTVVIGAGISGVAACELLLARGAQDLSLNDARPLSQWGPAAQALLARGVQPLAGHHELKLGAYDLTVISPGVPMFPALAAGLAAGARVWGEVELATRALLHAAPQVAIGGTNGKSTVTSLLGALLRAEREPVFVGGNLGEPLAPRAHERFAAVVLEVSSFQMERLERFAPDVALLLNVSDDHLDRYADFSAYVQAKGNMFERQHAAQLAIVPHGDALCLAQARRGQARVLSFGVAAAATVQITEDALLDHRDGERYLRSAIRLQGAHNAANAAAAIVAARDLGVTPAAIRRVLAEFAGLRHRTELVRERGGVRFYDDSKGTNVGAVVTALRGLSEPKAVLIAGGRDKDGSYAPLVEALAERGRALVLIGEAAARIAAAVGEVVPVHRADSMEHAVALAAELAQPGDAVLLSPACSSFDMFRDYKERGDLFAAAARALP